MATTFTRKDFLKGASAGALGAAVLGASGIISLAAEGTNCFSNERFCAVCRQWIMQLPDLVCLHWF